MIKNLSEQLRSFGLCAPRNYYIPFGKKQQNGMREESERFISLNGEWSFCAYKKLEEIEDDFCARPLPEKISVPSCVQYFGYDYFQYSNTRFPIPYDPPYVPVRNPAYHYSRTFSAEKEGKLYLVFEGVDSCFYVFVNGKYVGFSQISHRMSEFDITAFVLGGENRIDVVVQKWCAGTYFEDQDKWRFTGIFRDVYLLKRPEGHIVDYKIETRIDGRNAEVVFRHCGGGDAEVCFGGERKIVRAGEKVCFSVVEAKLWSAESPYLYDLDIECAGEKIFEQVGVRESEIRDGRFLWNGKPIKFYGVNRHDFHPEKGATVSMADMENDLRLMKRLNVNAVRTSHYPSAPEFYKLCDRYGIYVISESDLETHGTLELGKGTEGLSLEKKFGLLSDDVRFEETYIERQRANVETNKNRTCVAFWSLGNEAGYGRNIVAASREVKKIDSRPVHYESAIYVERPGRDDEYYSDVVDIQSRMYPSVEWMRDGFLSDTREKRPLFLCEYAHAMGNGPGGLKEYWDLMESNERFMGGCIWEWADHGVSYRGAPLRYGGDFGERLHNGNFCVDGIVTADRKLKSGSLEMKKAYQPLAFKRTEDGIALFNKNYFEPAVGKIVLTYKNYGTAEGEESFVVSVGPRETAHLSCKAAQTILVRFYTIEEKPGIPAGEELASAGFFENVENSEKRAALCGRAKISVQNGAICVKSSNLQAVFDVDTGEITKIIYRGKDYGGISPTIVRAPTDNDWSIDTALFAAENEAREISIKDDVIKVRGRFILESVKPVFSYVLCYTFGENGVSVYAEWEYPNWFDYMPRFGLVMKLPADFSKLRYCAYGPQESYIDKHFAAHKDVFESDVLKEYEHGYIMPQESGSHWDADFVELSDGSVVLRAEGMRSFCAIGYSAETLNKTKHDDELPASDAVYLTLDYAMSGVGSNSCGPKLPKQVCVLHCGQGNIVLQFMKNKRR